MANVNQIYQQQLKSFTEVPLQAAVNTGSYSMCKGGTYSLLGIQPTAVYFQSLIFLLRAYEHGCICRHLEYSIKYTITCGAWEFLSLLTALYVVGWGSAPQRIYHVLGCIVIKQKAAGLVFVQLRCINRPFI